MKIRISIDIVPEGGSDVEGLKFVCTGNKCPNDLMGLGQYVGSIVQEKMIASLPGVSGLQSSLKKAQDDLIKLKEKSEKKTKPKNLVGVSVEK